MLGITNTLQTFVNYERKKFYIIGFRQGYFPFQELLHLTFFQVDVPLQRERLQIRLRPVGTTATAVKAEPLLQADDRRVARGHGRRHAAHDRWSRCRCYKTGFLRRRRRVLRSECLSWQPFRPNVVFPRRLDVRPRFIIVRLGV